MGNLRKVAATVLAVAVMVCLAGCFASRERKVHVAAIFRPDSRRLEKMQEDAIKIVDELLARSDDTIYLSSVKMRVAGTASTAEAFLNQVEEALVSREDLRFVDRSRMEQVIDQHHFEQSLWSDDEKVAEVGRALNADILIFFDVRLLNIRNNSYEAQVEFLDVNTFSKRIVTVRNSLLLEIYTGSVGPGIIGKRKLQHVNLNF